MTPRRIGNPSRVPPFPGEVRVLLSLLVGRQPGEDAEPWLYGMVGVGWIESVRGGVAITEAGRDALARELLRGDGGPVVVVEDPAWIVFEDDALALLAIMTGRPFPMTSTTRAVLLRWGWVEVRRGSLVVTPAGRAALAAWLLRGWRP